MNGFVITTGSQIGELTAKAQEIAEKIGKLEVDMNGTAFHLLKIIFKKWLINKE